MAISNNPLLSSTRGTFNKQIVIRQVNGKTILSAYPDMSRRKLSVHQLKTQKRMADANEYAQDILADEQLRNAAQVRLNVIRNRLYHALIKEFFAKGK
ncbi:MAG: hypothetical protein JNK79_16645 [Chitinophagaceae bacterium]|nr:hypothetical protein [Chitinophagaceae bacterium]